MQRREYLTRVGAASAVGVAGATAGCSGGETTTTDPDTAGATTDDEPTDEETTDDTPGGGETPEETTESGPAQVVAVAPDGLVFDPDSFTVSVGDTVRWEWREGGHNVVPDEIPDGSDWTGSEGAPSETLSEGATHSHTFETAGEYSYYCNPHRGLGMTGSFTVE